MSGRIKIAKYEFADDSDITEVIFLGKCTKLSKASFANCKNLKKVVLPTGITKIPAYAFYNCESLEEIDISESQKIDETAFIGCKKLKDTEKKKLRDRKMIIE